MTALPAPAAILFDWDNTLVDNWPSIARALNAARRAFGHPELSEAAVRGWVRQSMRNSFPAMFGEAWTEAREIFYDTFRANHLETLKPLPGAAELLETLNGRGLYVGVVSNKNGDYLRKEIRHLAWTARFGRAVGAGDAVEDKPAVAPVDLALDGSGIGRSGAVWFVGDAAVDMECAIRAGCTPILRATADEPETAFSDWPPAAVADSSEGIMRLVDKARWPI
ncbi:MAG: HAD family hydrolase [Rhodospirillaceae bacterium]|nr:HAD family hydrolase [Rhodospirillaceae bacterium]